MTLVLSSFISIRIIFIHPLNRLISPSISYIFPHYNFHPQEFFPFALFKLGTHTISDPKLRRHIALAAPTDSLAFLCPLSADTGVGAGIAGAVTGAAAVPDPAGAVVGSSAHIPSLDVFPGHRVCVGAEILLASVPPFLPLPASGASHPAPTPVQSAPSAPHTTPSVPASAHPASSSPPSRGRRYGEGQEGAIRPHWRRRGGARHLV